MSAWAKPRRLSSSLISQLAVDFPTPAAPVRSKISVVINGPVSTIATVSRYRSLTTTARGNVN
jgi:hypothetical protein